MMMPDDEHLQFRESILAYLSGGLDADQRRRFESHAASCPPCAAELQAMRESDESLTNLFTEAHPSDGFEDRIIANLRFRATPPRPVHPMVRRAAIGVAAAVMIGTIGYVANRIENPPKPARYADTVVSSPTTQPSERTAEEKKNMENTVAQLIKVSRDLIDNRNYGQATGVNAQILAIDPHNEYALGVRKVVEDAAVHQQQKYREQFDNNYTPQLNRTEEGKIPYGDILMYAGNWPGITSKDARTDDNSYTNGPLSLNPQAAVKYRSIRGEAAKDSDGDGIADSGFTAQSYTSSKKTPQITWHAGIQVPQSAVAANDENSENLDARISGKAATGGATESNISNGVVVGAVGISGTADQKPATNEGQNMLYADGHVEFPTAATEGFRMNPTAGAATGTVGGTSKIGRDGTIALGAAGAVASDYPYTPLPFDKAGDGWLADRVNPQGVGGIGGGKAVGPQSFDNAGPDAAWMSIHVSLDSGAQAGKGGEIEKKSVAGPANAPAPVIDALTGGLSIGGLSGSGSVKIPAPAAAPAAAKPAVPPASEPATVPSTAPSSQKIIRNGEMEFEVDHFDSAFVLIAKIAAEEGGFVASTDSQKLTNGKMRGVVTVRVGPEHLDLLVLKLRALGELKSQRLTAQDITKEYTDLASELRAARAMQDRLLAMIKDGKGQIKDLLAAEKELAVWREKSERIEGEIRYDDSRIALSTLAITMQERDLATPAELAQTETVDTAVECDDVESARTATIKAVEAAGGRIVESELKKFDAGQLAARVVAEVPEDSTGPVIDRLKQLGRLARYQVQRQQTADGADLPADVKVQRKPTRFVVALYNLANVQPRQTVNLDLAATDVESAYRAVLAQVEKSGGRVISSGLSEPKADQVSATIRFESPAAAADALLNDVRSAGEVIHLSDSENPASDNVTSAKRGFLVQLVSYSATLPRQTTQRTLAARSVSDAYADILAAAQAAHGRILVAQLNEQDRQNITGYLDFEIPTSAQDSLEKVIGSAGDIVSRNVSRAGDGDNVVQSKVQMKLNLVSADSIPPRQTVTAAIETAQVDQTLHDIQAWAVEAGGRTTESHLSRQSDGAMVGQIAVEAPLARLMVLEEKVKLAGTVRNLESWRNPQVPDGALSRGRMEVTVATPESIVAGDEGVGASFHQGLATGVRGLLSSLRYFVIGFCLTVPWALLGWAGWKVIRRRRGSQAHG